MGRQAVASTDGVRFSSYRRRAKRRCSTTSRVEQTEKPNSRVPEASTLPGQARKRLLGKNVVAREIFDFAVLSE